MENKKTFPIVYEEIHFETEHQVELIYDEHSHKIILINKQTNEMSVYAKNGKVFLIKRTIKYLHFRKINIIKIILLKLNWCVILSNEDNISQLTIIKLQEGKTFGSFQGDYSRMIGLFFFEEEDVTLPPKICGIYQHKIEFYMINQLESKLEIWKKIILEKKRKFTYYKYEPNYKLLCIQRGDIENLDQKLTFHFYNMADEKFYRKFTEFEIIVEKLSLGKKIQKKIEKYQWDKKEHCKKEILINYSPLFRLSQFFMEKIYNKLYFIWLSYSSKKIIFYNLIILDDIVEEFDIKFKGNEIALQFFDNLFFVHDIDDKTTTVYDFILKEKDQPLSPLIPSFSMTNAVMLIQNTDNIFQITETNEMIYSKMRKIKSKIIYTNEEEENNNENKLYYVYFNLELFYFYYADKKKALEKIFYRKNGKYFILKRIEQALKYNCYSKINRKLLPVNKFHTLDIQYVFRHICFLIEKSQSVMTLYASQRKKVKEYIDVRQSFDSLFPKKKHIISFDDLHYQTFNTFENDDKIIPEKVIYFHFILKNELNLFSFKPSSSFYCTLIAFLKRVNHFYLIDEYFKYNYFGNSQSLAMYLLNDVCFNKDKEFTDKEREIAFQYGIDMLYRMKLYLNICECLINRGLYKEVFIIIRKYKINMKKFTEEQKEKLGLLIKEYLSEIM